MEIRRRWTRAAVVVALILAAAAAWILTRPRDLRIYEHNVPRSMTYQEIIERTARVDPEQQALEDHRRGDASIVGIRGMAVSFPEASADEIERMPHKVLAGTGDYIQSEQAAAWNTRAEDFATRYNKVKLSLWRK